MTSKSNRSKSYGFTLIEVLITVGILATVLLFIFRSFAASLAAGRLSQDIALACYLSEAKTWEIEEAYSRGFSFENSGSESEQNKDFRWRAELNDTGDSGIKELRFTVSWKENPLGRDESISFVTYLSKK